MTCIVKFCSPSPDAVCSFPPVVSSFTEVFVGFPVGKGDKYHIIECYLVWSPANRLPFRGQEKS